MSDAPALHFVRFKDDRVLAARRVWGEPDFYHRLWDRRARSMLLPGDVAVFADGDENDEPQVMNWDDSQARAVMSPGDKGN